MQPLKPVVVVTRAGDQDFRHDFAALPPEYGQPAFEERADVRAIRAALNANLNELDRRTGFTRFLSGRPVVIKPNLVTVYHCLGTVEPDYPESTDPRLIDALVLYLQQYTSQITIVESSGRAMPTRGSFRISGLNRLARLRGVRLAALEEEPVERYLLPQASVMREILAPAAFGPVIRGEAFFISMPKLKTNLYTAVTLGFKNSMGIIPYNLRQRNHTYALDDKLVDMLQIFRPDLTLIDGLVGGEGNCPAPVDAVDSRLLLSGTQVVETDRIAARLMGFDPQQIALLCAADERGLGDAAVEVVGDLQPVAFRPADPSLMSARFRQRFPNVRVLVGLPERLQRGEELGLPISPAEAERLEMACRGGCLASARFAFEMIEREGLPTDFYLTVLIGRGMGPHQVFYDAQGQPYSPAQIEALPGRKMVMGACARAEKGLPGEYIAGCMPLPNAPHAALHRLTGTRCRVLTLRNRFLLPLAWDTLQMRLARRRLLKQGRRLDVDLFQHDRDDQPRELDAAESGRPVLVWPLPVLTPEESRAALRAEWQESLRDFLL